MKRILNPLLRRIFRDERGQIIPWMVLLSGLMIGVGGLSVDLGRAYICYNQLKASTNAAAMAGAYAMIQPGATKSTVTSAINLYASATNGANANANLTGTTIGTPVFTCVKDSVMVVSPCSASPTGYNVVQVQQTVNVPTLLIRVLPFLNGSPLQSIRLIATSTATMASGADDQVNVAMVLDSTKSMSSSENEPACKSTRINCALDGVQYLLQQLSPCTASTSSPSATCVSYDRVSLFTYPNVNFSNRSLDTTCNGTMTSSNILPYTTPAKPTSGQKTWTAPSGTNGTYQITGYSSDWSSNNQIGGSFVGNSNLVNATGGSTGSNCNGIQAIGGQGTYFAGAIYEAQASLMAQAYQNPGSKNVMIILSDGDASATSGHMINGLNGSNVGNAGNTYPSLQDQCHQAIAAAQQADSLGTTVYTIAYGAQSSGCSTDSAANGSSSISPCATMQQMSSGYVSTSNMPHFYSDSATTTASGQCSSQYNLNLQGIFGSIVANLTKARLIPNNVT
jgi:Flp pilus assembly protein TadG